MSRLLLRRLAMVVPLVWLVATMTFVVVQAAPGTYADHIDHPRLSPEAREIIRQRYGLDQPVHVQYLRWLIALARGDLGRSFHFKRPVSIVLTEAIPPTLLLAGSALLLDLVLGIVLAVGAVRRPGGWVDRSITVLGLGLYGLPSFWLAGLAVFVFCLVLGWLPPSHMHSVGADTLTTLPRLFDLLQHLVLPACCLGVVGATATARYLRASLLELRSAGFVTAARARGLSERRIFWVHILRPALTPVVTIVGLSIPVLFSGSVVIESVFSWPGMGQLLLLAAQARDLPVIMAVTMVGALGVIVGSLVADLAYALIDPRVKDR